MILELHSPYNMIFQALTTFLAVLTLTSGCDEFSWKELSERYDKCVVQNGLQSLKLKPLSNQKFCSKFEDITECSEYLRFCMDSHFEEIQEKLGSLRLDKLTSKCRKHRDKRSAGKNGGSRGSQGRSTARRVVDKVKSKGRQIVDKIRHRGQSRNSGHNAGGFGASQGLAGGAGIKKESRRKKILKKVGKYAVAGLAAYGTYKLAKAMTKGLRGAYDSDDCWDYSYLRGQYECVCPGQCHVYVGSASSLAATGGLLCVSVLVSYSIGRFNLDY